MSRTRLCRRPASASQRQVVSVAVAARKMALDVQWFLAPTRTGDHGPLPWPNLRPRGMTGFPVPTPQHLTRGYGDFLFGPKSYDGRDTYILCEINVRSGSPFPDAALAPLVAGVARRLQVRGHPSFGGHARLRNCDA